ncbi:MBL fold metallo-hydrolase [Serratia marcescens]|jgi:beta-lactamase superfamily II metal-dependent hydrolase|uniref:Metallo-beta-lactamase domain-containing protein n=1 Tax=Serratia marcescens TaxID=615 RepID=A0AAP8PGP4_SERMA|nr:MULTISPECIES: MBL fold metallo-hydrolase [Serratia]MBH2707409.1 MBL fold metallo-hydrolase [Serratia marcescens]MBH3130748.1 MBL fold metallo-hydrolase [Serratia marcescens]MBH3272096.1 MBL fold metallo-hydrolase [Serratia marcescens]MBN5206058.1 MBL fold metallo-hydrolase [Serratia marcescens]MBN5406102.1 MBL fold metallo-hydrolase [Serratia marcescens]
MSLIKSFSVSNGDMFYIKHNSDNFTIIDCYINEDNADAIIKEMQAQAKGKGISRFISTHPDEDHFGGIHLLDDAMKIYNFYVVKNKAIKEDSTPSFERYCTLRDGEKAFYISQDCSRKWMNVSDDQRDSSGLSILWPKIDNPHFAEALNASERGESYNNISAVVRYKLNDGASVMWLGDLETEFMENIINDVELQETTVVFASHHGRDSGKIPNSWLDKIKPKVIIIGEAPSRNLNYYTGYKKITQNRAGDITMDCVGNKVHFYVSSENYPNNKFDNENAQDTELGFYIGSITV